MQCPQTLLSEAFGKGSRCNYPNVATQKESEPNSRTGCTPEQDISEDNFLENAATTETQENCTSIIGERAKRARHSQVCSIENRGYYSTCKFI